jgi:hypothetical protein
MGGDGNGTAALTVRALPAGNRRFTPRLLAGLAGLLVLSGVSAGGCSSPFSSSSGSGGGHGAHDRGPTANSPPATVAIPQVPVPSRSLIGIGLSGVGSHLTRPAKPTYMPYHDDCQRLIDTAFTGKCVIASGPGGTVAGVVEQEAGAFSGQGRQERDLVWHRQGAEWSLALRHVFDVCLNALVCSGDPGLPTLLWSDDIRRDHGPQLVFVLPTDRRGYGSELDVVDDRGGVALYRYLGEGFAVVPPTGGLVTYVPGATEAKAADDYFDQVLIRFFTGHWRLISEQYVPYAAALAQHKAAFWDPRAVPASPRPTQRPLRGG